MPTPITASMLYDLVACEHRVAMDLFEDPRNRDPVSPFVQLLWERGSLFEKKTIGKLDTPFVDLSAYSLDEKERRTDEAMAAGVPLIYAGRIRAGDLLGDPDLLRKEDGGYVPGDIKSGAGEEGDDDNRKPKLHYAMQLGLYVDILEQKGLLSGRKGFIWDVHGEEVIYDFGAPRGVRDPKTLWQEYQETLHEARQIVGKQRGTQAAYTSTCKNCYWYSVCLSQLKAQDDLTLIPELGRSRREALSEMVRSIRDFSKTDPTQFIRGKKTVFAGIGSDMLLRFHGRARLLCDPNGKPFLKETVQLPSARIEIFFDIEVDPMRDVCYLHGFVEREEGTERYIPFFAENPTAVEEEEAFAKAWEYLQQRASAPIYYYSKYERTIWRKLREKYPSIAAAAEIEALFDPARAVDLYFDVVRPKTEWPTKDFSIKTLAQHLGFSWRDSHPSGAASIEWFHKWVETRDPEVRQRILDYNEDDCRATRVLLDGIRQLPVCS